MPALTALIRAAIILDFFGNPVLYNFDMRHLGIGSSFFKKLDDGFIAVIRHIDQVIPFLDFVKHIRHILQRLQRQGWQLFISQVVHPEIRKLKKIEIIMVATFRQLV